MDEAKEHIFAGDCYQVVLSSTVPRNVKVEAFPFIARAAIAIRPYTYLLKLAMKQ